MKTLYANGCSMTYGAELGGEYFDKNNQFMGEIDPKYRENLAWPKLLANSLNMMCINDAEPACSNNRIFRTTIDWTAKYLKDGNNPHNLFVIIGWTEPSRKEYRLDGKWETLLPNCSPECVKKNDINFYNLYVFHLENLLDENYDSMLTLQYILSLQSWFKTNQISYLFCNALDNTYDNRDKSIENMIFHVDKKRYFKFDNDYNTMCNVIHKFPVGPRLHPLEEGHAAWASTLFDYIIDKGLIQYD